MKLKFKEMGTIKNWRFLLAYLLFTSLAVVLSAQQSEVLKQGMGTLSLSVRPIIPNQEASPSESEVLVRFSLGPKLSKKAQNEPIKYAGRARIWFSASTYELSQAFFSFTANSRDLYIKPKSNGEAQDIIISGVPDFQYLKSSVTLLSGRSYQIEIDIAQESESLITESSSSQTETFLFQEHSTDNNTGASGSKASNSNEGWFKRVYSNKYVRWGVGAALLSAGGYFGYTQFFGSSGSASLPEPPAPPTVSTSGGGS